MTWYLHSFQEGNDSVMVIPNTTLTAFFDGQGNFSGSSGCNQFSASYKGTQNTLRIDPPVSTKMNCSSPSGIMTQEALYLSRIQETQTYSADSSTFILRDDQGETLLIYTSTPPGTSVPAPLLGTTWYVKSFVDDKGQIFTPQRLTTIKLLFSADGHLYGNAGCNDHFGPYQQTGKNSLVIGDQQMTRAYCGIAGMMELETAYLTLLPNVTRHSISNDTLLLSDADDMIKIELETQSR